MSAAPCSCGERENHILASRKTSDGMNVCLWSDGSIAGRFGHQIAGIPLSRPRTHEQHSAALEAGWMFIREVALFSLAELPDLHKASRKASSWADMYLRFERMQQPRICLTWHTYATDRDGKPTVRVARLGLRWPRMVVWHEKGRYEVLERMHGRASDTLTPTGMKFATLRELFAAMEEAR